MANPTTKEDGRFKRFLLHFKSDRKKAAAGVFILVSLGALLYPAGTWFMGRINLDLGGWLGRPVGESLRDIFKRVAAQDKDLPKIRRAAGGGGAEGLGLVASGDFGNWNMAKKLPNPSSIQGILTTGEDLDRPEGVHVEGEGAVGAQRGSASFSQGSAPAYVGKALQGPGGAASPSIDENLLGMATPLQAPGAAHGASMPGRKYAISRGELRGFLTNDAQVDAVVSRRIVGQGASNSAAHQLAQAKVTAGRYAASPVAEEKAMIGAVYEKHKVPLRSLTATGGISHVYSTFPDLNPDDGMTNEMAQSAECIDAVKQVKFCSGAKAAQYLQLADLTDQLTNLSVKIAINCADKCPHECGACTKNNITQQQLCAEMRSLIVKIDRPCHMPKGCYMDINQHGSGKSIVPRVYNLGDCAVKHVCGESNKFWGKVYCQGQLMVDSMTGKPEPVTGGCSDQDRAAGNCS